MKRFAIVFALFACASAPTKPGQMGVLIPGADINDVRNAVVAQVVGSGFSVLSSGENLITAEMPMRDDASGYYFAHREYFIYSVPKGVRVSGSARLVDKRSPALVRYDPRREVFAMGIDTWLSADIAALQAKLGR